MTQKECGGQIQIMRQKGTKDMGRSSALGRKPQRRQRRRRAIKRQGERKRGKIRPKI